MRSVILTTCIALFATSALAQPNPNVASTDPLSPADEKKALHLPPGFEIQLVASEPDIHKPINIAFDDKGRLWVTDTVEYPFPAPPDRKARDSVKILEDFDENGKARKITTFADDLNIPIGVLPLDDGALVYSIPNIYRLRDTTGSGKADKREVLFGPYGHKDTHGMTSAFAIGFDGWVYAVHGYANDTTIKGTDGSSISMNSGNTYRFKLDGSHVEYFTHGQVNPFGLCFDPLGNLFSSDCETRPIFQLLRGGWYPSFSKPHDGLGFAPQMMAHMHGSTAIAGIVYYAADHFPEEFHDNIFVGNVVTNCINRDRLERHGSSYKAVEQPDFVKSDDPWFRPVALQMGPDGALYVADFYNRIIGHYEVDLKHPGRDRERGRIWRIIYTGKDGKNRPKAPRQDWTKASVAELIDDLGHPNLAVRMKAMHQLAGRDDKKINDAVLALMKPESKHWQRMHGMWVLERRGTLDDKILESLIQDKNPAVRTHAQKVLADRPKLTAEQRQLTLARLEDADGFVKRAAAETLETHPDAQNIQPLLKILYSRANADDDHLLHMVRMALRNQMAKGDSWNSLPFTASDRDQRAIDDVCTGIPAPEAAKYLAGKLPLHKDDADGLRRFAHHIARYGVDSVRTELTEFVRKQIIDRAALQAVLLKEVNQGMQEGGAKLPDSVREWATDLTQSLLASSKPGDVPAALDLAGSLKLAGVKETVQKVARKTEVAEGDRAAALVYLLNVDAAGSVPLLGQVLNDASEPITLREHAARLLSQQNQPEAHAELAKALPAAPARLQSVLAIGLAGSAGGAEKLLTAVTEGKASARLLQEPAVLERLRQSKPPELASRLEKLTKGLPAPDKQMEQLLVARRDLYLKAKPDLAQGAKIFEKSCAICHRIADKGQKFGPQLDGIGIRGLDRLLEDVLDPNRNVDQAFRSTKIFTKKGQLISGLVLREEGEVIVLADAQGKEVRVEKQDVDDRTVTPLSPMPANFATQISEEDLNHLMAYLLSQRAPK
jgi:putative heme-binding domain-containing protein